MRYRSVSFLLDMFFKWIALEPEAYMERSTIWNLILTLPLTGKPSFSRLASSSLKEIRTIFKSSSSSKFFCFYKFALHSITWFCCCCLESFVLKSSSSCYFRAFTYYKMGNLDNRIANPDQLLTQDVEKFCNSVVDLYSNLSKVSLSVFVVNSLNFESKQMYMMNMIAACKYLMLL